MDIKKKKGRVGKPIEMLDGGQPVSGTDANLLEFWRWAYSDIAHWSVRGDFAEFLVRVALFPKEQRQAANATHSEEFVGVSDARTVMDHVDFHWFDERCGSSAATMREPFLIEVKSAEQAATFFSEMKPPLFEATEHEGWDADDPEKPIVKVKRLWADIYILCCFVRPSDHGRDNVHAMLNIENWRFRVVCSHEIMESLSECRQLGIVSVKNLAPTDGAAMHEEEDLREHVHTEAENEGTGTESDAKQATTTVALNYLLRTESGLEHWVGHGELLSTLIEVARAPGIGSALRQYARASERILMKARQAPKGAEAGDEKAEPQSA